MEIDSENYIIYLWDYWKSGFKFYMIFQYIDKKNWDSKMIFKEFMLL